MRPISTTGTVCRRFLIITLAVPLGATLAVTASPAGNAVAAAHSPRVTPAVAGTWKKLPAAPVSKLPIPLVSVWTGSQMIIHGAYPSAVTFAYRPPSNTWAKLRPGPRPLNLEATDIAVWTGARMLVMGLTNGSYNPATNTWQPIAPLIMPNEDAVAGWTGRIVLVWGGVCCDDISNRGAAYRPSTNTWFTLPVAPLQPRRSAAGAWTGKELIVAGGASGTGEGSPAFRDAAAYDPIGRAWRKLAPMPAARWGATGLWDGEELLVVGGWAQHGTGSALATRGLAYNPAANRWRWLPVMPYPRHGFAAVWTGRHVLVWGGLTSAGVPPPHGVAYTPATNRWTDLPASPLAGRAYPTAVWTGKRMIVWGGSTQSRDFTDGAAFTPAG